MKKIPERIALPLVFVVGFLIGLFVLWAVMANIRHTAPPSANGSPSSTSQTKQSQAATTTGPSTSETATTTNEGTSSSTASEPVQDLSGFQHAPDLTPHVEDVTWSQKPTAMSSSTAQQVLSNFATDTSMVFRTDQEAQSASGNGDDEQLAGLWKMGTVASGDWQGADVYLLRSTAPEPGGLYEEMFVLKNGTAFYLPKYSPESFGQFAMTNLQPVSNVAITSLDAPATLTLQDGKTIVREGTGFPDIGFWQEEAYTFEIDAKDLATLKQVAMTQDGRALYAYPTLPASDTQGFTNHSGCIFLILPDGQLVKYRSGIPAKPQKGQDPTEVLPDVMWNAAYANTDLYNDRAIGGCGAMGCADVVSDADVGPTSTLVVAGQAADGSDVYVPAKPTQSALVKTVYDDWYVPDGNKPSIDAFVRKYPAAVFFWKDALGRWVRLTTAAAMSQVECGKPVIYLYPKATTDVSVALPSSISVTQSEPTYQQNGWHVTAHPDGSLTNSDGQTYGSLYWEGTGVAYAPPTDGFVIKDGDVGAQLKTILAKYGLNEKESQDFRDFWVPKMISAPYYRVSFLTSAWSAAAPLRVTPRPTSEIRIFMDWQKLDAPVSIPAPKIVTPVRNGFTLVEWGGLLRQ